MAGQKATGIRRLVNASHYSWQGLKAAFQHEAAFRQELLLFVLLAPVGLLLGETGIERAVLLASVLLLLVVELLNSAIEAVVDRFGGDQHELSGRAKDMGSAAVLITLVLVIVVWCLILWR